MYVYGNPANAGVARIILGPNPAAGNLDYCSMIESSNSNAGNYQSWLKFYTHDGASSGGDPTLRMSIDNIGRVGIGQANPGYTLDVNGTTRSQKLLGTLTNTGAIAPISPFAAQNGNPNTGGSLAQIEFQYRDGGYNHYIATRHNSVVANNKSAIDFWLHSTTTSDGSTAPGTANVNMMSVTAAGVGINNSTPSYTLDVGGQIRIYETTGTNVVAGTANTMPTTAIAGKTSGSLTLYHNNANGHSSILFPSKTNDGGDYGYITFMDDVSNRAGSEESRLLIGCDNDYATDHVILQPFGGRVGVGQMLPAYKFDMFGGAANFSFDSTYGAAYVGTHTGMLLYAVSSGDGTIRADQNVENSVRVLYLGVGYCNVVDISRSDVQCHPTNALYVRNDKGAGNFVVEGTSYLNNISNTNLYATSAIVSGTTAGRLVMIGVQSGCYIEAGLNSDTGSAAPLYFTDMNNAHQWMCIGSTGNVGINNNSPVGRFHVKTSGNALDTFLGWDSTWMLVTPVANSGIPSTTAGLGLGYSAASNTAYVTALAPQDSWKDLRLDASNIQLVPHSPGIVNVSGGFKVVHGTRTFSTSNGNFNFGVYGVYDPEPYGAIQITQPSNNLDYTSNGQWGYSIIQNGSRVSGIGMLPNNAGKIVIGSGTTPTDGSSNGITVDVTNKRLGIACNAPAYSLDVNGIGRMSGVTTVASSNTITNGTVPAVAGPFTTCGTWICHANAVSTSNAASVMMLVYRVDGTTFNSVVSILCGGAITVALTAATTSNYYIGLQNSSGTTQSIRWSFLQISGVGF
jgi:hypothetical protein